MEMEKYTDPLDIAARNESIATADSLRIVRDAAIPTQSPKVRELGDGTKEMYFEITDCVKCGEEIGDKRLHVAIKNTLCIECATAQERKIR